MGQKKEGECWAVSRESERRRGELRRSGTAVETIGRGGRAGHGAPHTGGSRCGGGTSQGFLARTAIRREGG